MSLVLKAENIYYSVKYKNKDKAILTNLSFEMERNSVLGISGESGSGKTTLGKIIAGIIKPTGGKLNFQFEKKNKKISPVQVLFQNTGEIINPLRDVRHILEEAIEINNNNNDIHVENLLNAVKLPEYILDRKGYELSGGEQQRVALAKILAVKPELLILDEPFSAQDYESQKNLLNLFISLKKSFEISIICITHNLRLLKIFSDDVLIMLNGEIVERNESTELFKNPQHYYTKFLLKAAKYNLNKEDFINQNKIQNLS